ncbi:hypothetical protein BHE74_00046865, partial [Ensete ventricosum]
QQCCVPPSTTYARGRPSPQVGTTAPTGRCRCPQAVTPTSERCPYRGLPTRLYHRCSGLAVVGCPCRWLGHGQSPLKVSCLHVATPFARRQLTYGCCVLYKNA